MAVVTTACRHRRNHSMTQSPKHAFALTPVIQCVFPEGFRQRVARRRRYHRDPEVGTNSLAIGFRTLSPFWRRFICLVDATQNRGAGDWIRAKCVEEVVPELYSFRRTRVGQVQL